MKRFLLNNRVKLIINFILFFLAIFQSFIFIGLPNLNIYNFNWLFQGDTSADVVNWLKFKNSDWLFPIGLFENSELGKSSLAYTGAVPFLSIFFKLFFKEFENFQYFGLWIFLCFYLQLLFSYLILIKKTNDIIFSILGSLFFALSPIMFHRLGYHLSLSGHWILLAYFLNKILADKKYYQMRNIFIICFSSLIHFYFTLMILWIELFHTFYNYLKEKKNIKDYLKYLFLIFIPLSLTMYLIGYFEIPFYDTLGGGYGVFKMNLLSFINPLGQTLQHNQFNWSFFLPIYGDSYGEKEGFGYFGLGILFLILISLYYFVFEKKIKINKNFCIILISLIIYSLSNKIDFGSYNLIEINLDKRIEAILSIGRASGRFIWPVYYFIMFFSLILIYKKFLKKGIYLILIFLLIQIIDIAPGLSKYISAGAYNNKSNNLDNDIWGKIKSKNLILSSTFIQNGGSDFYKTLDLNIKDIKMEITNLARYDRKKLFSLRYKNYDNFYQSIIEKEKVYLINNLGHLNHIKYLFRNSNNQSIFKKDGLWMIVDKDHFKDEKKKNSEINKINSKKILVNEKYKPKFIGGSFEQSFLGLGWANHRYDTVSEGSISSLLFDLSDLTPGNYEILFNITPNILKDNQEITIEMGKQKYIFDKKREENISLKIDTSDVNNLSNFVVNFYNSGLITEYDVLKSPDTKLIAFKLNFLLLKKI